MGVRDFPIESGWTMPEAVTWLDGLGPWGIELGTERVARALGRLGVPYRVLPAVTIAGTNGKGSTAAFLASLVHTAGYRVGLYTSPHLVGVTERIRIGGMPILPREFARWMARIRAVVEGSGQDEAISLTYFEVLTVMAIGYFTEREVDLAVLEVGLGGRLDATAVVPPLVSVITPIGYDHQALLGHTLDAICREKAGIIREGATVVTNVTRELFRDVVGPRAFALRCPIRRQGIDFIAGWLHGGFRYRGWLHRLGPVRLGIAGLHQAGNAALACAAAESLSAHGFRFKSAQLAEGLHRARHAGRLERRGPRVDPNGRRWPALLLDGAHNPMGAEILGFQLGRHLPERPRVLLFAAKHGKDIAGMLRPLGPHIDAIVLTRIPGLPLSPIEPLTTLCRRYRVPLSIEYDVASALDLARRQAGSSGGILVAGSLYLVGAVLPLLPARQPASPLA